MEVDRTHRTTTTTSRELFICFTSRLSSSSSSSSMKISKSILSPGRSRDPPISLSTSLSRRLRTNGSIKGGQASPIFPTTGKKNKCAFENPEPSSPKVTCIGQVRVKSKKKQQQQGKKLRSLSRRHSAGGEVSFRRLEQARDGFSQSQNQNVGPSYHQDSMPQRNQRWVHLPLTICEALRTEFNCLFPCKSSCFSTSEREKEEREARSGQGNAGGQSSCGAVFRWLVAVQDTEGGGGKGGGREIELVVGDVDDDSGERRRKSRRHVFDDLEIVDNRIHLKDECGGGRGGDEEGGARVSICIPPKNALLLMRCRSDPVQMEALTSKFWESTAPLIDEEEEVEKVEDKDDAEDEFKDCEIEEKEEKGLVFVEVDIEEQENVGGEEPNLEIEKENQEERLLEINEAVEEETEDLREEIEDESMFLDCLFEEFDDEQVVDPIMEEETKMEDNVKEAIVEEIAEFEAKEETIEEKEEAQDVIFEDSNEMMLISKMQEETKSKERESENQVDELVRESEMQVKALPDCLLLMMCEPKLSMEVSKETWVCSTDFIRRQQPHRKKPPMVKPIVGGDEDSSTKKAAVNVVHDKPKNNPPPVTTVYRETNPILHHQPPRSSCCLPAPAASMATMIEQKLVNAMGCEPFVLTRCKSEPMRNASKRVPETCFWKNRKLEPLRRAACGGNTAGLGF